MPTPVTQAGSRSTLQGEGSISVVSPNDNHAHASPDVPVSGTDSALVKRGRGRPRVSCSLRTRSLAVLFALTLPAWRCREAKTSPCHLRPNQRQGKAGRRKCVYPATMHETSTSHAAHSFVNVCLHQRAGDEGQAQNRTRRRGRRCDRGRRRVCQDPQPWPSSAWPSSPRGGGCGEGRFCIKILISSNFEILIADSSPDRQDNDRLAAQPDFPG